MNAVILEAMARLTAHEVAGRPLLRVVPAGRTGVHLVFAGAAHWLRLETWPERGGWRLTDRAPERLRGGRGAWPDLVGAADSTLAGRQVTLVAFAERPPTLRLTFEGDSNLAVHALRQGGVITLERPGMATLALPGLAGAAPALAGVLARAREALGPVNPLALEDAPPAAVHGPPGFPEGPARASWAGALSIEWPCTPRAGPAAAAPGASLIVAADAWWDASAAAFELAARRAAAVRLVRRAGDRVRRALAALAEEDAFAAAPAELRRIADALLAAGPFLSVDAAGRLHAPDPYQPGVTLEVPADPPGASPPAVAGRLYARARRAERGLQARARRREELRRQEAALATLLDAATTSDTGLEIGRAEEAARRLGLPAGVEAPAKARPSAGRGGTVIEARLFRSPGGLEVLVGKTAQENDHLTFRVAAPDDYWLHAKGWAGAHVVVRVGRRREAPAADLLYAAKLAAAFSQAPRGEVVEVLVSRRKHVKKPRGAAPGAVRVDKASALRVRAEAPSAI